MRYTLKKVPYSIHAVNSDVEMLHKGHREVEAHNNDCETGCHNKRTEEIECDSDQKRKK